MRNPFRYFKTSSHVIRLAVTMSVRFPLSLRQVEDLLHERGIDVSYLWRAVDHEGEVLEVFVTKKRDRKAALRFLKKAMRRHGSPRTVVTDRLRPYRAAMKVIGIAGRQVTGRWLNNRAENSHQPFRRRERAMAKFKSTKSLQKFASIHSSIHNHFNQERHLHRRQDFKIRRCAALTEWRQLTV